MRSRRGPVALALLGLLLGLPLGAAEPEPAPAMDATGSHSAPPPAGQREYEAQPLPDDTFKPSEEVSEDYAVPFPVDI